MREDDTDSPRESDAARARAHANDCIGTVAFISIFSLFSAFNVQKGGERKRERERESETTTFFSLQLLFGLGGRLCTAGALGALTSFALLAAHCAARAGF